MGFRSRKPQPEPAMSADDAKAILAQIKAGDLKVCSHCGGCHARACPRVQKMVFMGDEIKEVTFFQEWDDQHIIWPDEIQELVDNAESE